MRDTKIAGLEKMAAGVRYDILNMLLKCGAGHLGGSFSIVELLCVLYGSQMNHDPANPDWSGRDYLVLSKGHAGPALYATLAHQGYFAHDQLDTLNCGGTDFPSHPDRLKTIGVDVTTGSLGQGTSQAAGVAYGLKLAKRDNHVYLIVGDGELNEGQCWEAFQFIAHYRLDNLIVIIDDNKKQLDGYTQDVMNPFDIAKKMEAFGFYTMKVKGDDLEAIDLAVSYLRRVGSTAKCIVLDTIKGQGIGYFEELMDNHSVKFDSQENQKAAKTALDELEKLMNREAENV